MANDKDFDSFGEFESKKQNADKLPLGWLLLFVGLILWGVYYTATYTPAISGWTQAGAYEQSVKK